MKCSTTWLKEWVDTGSSLEKLCDLLTMSGLEVESLTPEEKDHVIDVSITPNRGDCMSVKGLAREIAALTKTILKNITFSDVKPTSKDIFPVTIEEKSACPRYVGRVIRNLKADAITPTWITERLRQCGTRSINPVVDVTNYVMYELGQPMHAFDLKTLQEKIIVRNSKAGEKIALLDGTEKELDDKTLIIADRANPLAIAGVMGGLGSSVTSLTTDIFLESAYFALETVAHQRQYYNLSSDSASRFERGVDPTIQRQAIERATQLIVEIAGGEAGPVIEEISDAQLPQPVKITLPNAKIKRVLGIEIPANDIKDIFTRLSFEFALQNNQWIVTIPSYRFDMTIPEDLIEEIARLYGYDRIPTHSLVSTLSPHSDHEEQDLSILRSALRDQSYHEIISYSFIDKPLQQLFDPQTIPTELVNPMTANMSVMRTNLWPGLINTFLYNKSRQQQRIRLFEIGTCFNVVNGKLVQEQRVAGLIAGTAHPEQWGTPSREVDFFDLKGDIANIAKLAYQADTHPALHPGQTAALYHQDHKIGVLGALHPSVMQALDLPQASRVYVFELSLNQLPKAGLARFEEVSKFPEIRRDLAIMVKQTVPAKEIQDTIRKVAGDWLKDVFIFDVYQGKGISPGLKSMALGLILQHQTRTLVDDEVAQLVDRVLIELKGQLGAELRS